VSGGTRTIEWQDPMVLAQAAATRSGLDFMRAIQAGELPPPPIGSTLGFGDLPVVEEGRVVFRLQPDSSLYNPIGTVHGGVHATLLDSAMGCAVHTVLPQGTGYTTLELKVNYVRAVHAGAGPILAEGTVVHHGGRVATAEGRITSEETGKLLAHGTTTCLILRP
jgi:uncharacterized protein (TIGR00369 family)